MVNFYIIVVVFYILILFIAAILPLGEISNYNGYILLFFCLFFFVKIKAKKVYKEACLCSILICLFSLYQPVLYVLINCSLIYFILSCIYIGVHYELKKLTVVKLEKSFLVVYVLSVLMMNVPSLYILNAEGGMRYGGIFHAINLSANIFAILGIVIWEMEKYVGKSRKILLLFLLLCVVLYIGMSETRSLIFSLPYWIYQIYCLGIESKYKKILINLLIILLVVLFPYFIRILTEKLRFQEGESSMATRVVLYTELINGILSGYVLQPHGVHASQQLIVDYTLNEDYSPHNDFLSYLYDWGFIFFLFIYLLFRQFKNAGYLNLEFGMILLVVASFALHNMLFSMFIWIPFIAILIMRKKKQNGKTSIISCCSKI